MIEAAILYLLLACATVVPAPFSQVPEHAGQQPAPPTWAVACVWLNQAGVQRFPSLNPQ